MGQGRTPVGDEAAQVREIPARGRTTVQGHKGLVPLADHYGTPKAISVWGGQDLIVEEPGEIIHVGGFSVDGLLSSPSAGDARGQRRTPQGSHPGASTQTSATARSSACSTRRWPGESDGSSRTARAEPSPASWSPTPATSAPSPTPRSSRTQSTPGCSRATRAARVGPAGGLPSGARLATS